MTKLHSEFFLEPDSQRVYTNTYRKPYEKKESEKSGINAYCDKDYQYRPNDYSDHICMLPSYVIEENVRKAL